jgi:hypothetical protein
MQGKIINTIIKKSFECAEKYRQLDRTHSVVILLQDFIRDVPIRISVGLPAVLDRCAFCGFPILAHTYNTITLRPPLMQKFVLCNSQGFKTREKESVNRNYKDQSFYENVS